MPDFEPGMWVREPPGWYGLDDPDPGYDEIMRRPAAGPIAILWGEGKVAYIDEDGEVIARFDGS